MESISTHHGGWIFIVPVSGVVLTRAVNYEYTIVRTTLISSDRLSRVRRRFGFPERLSFYRKDPNLNHVFEKSDVIALIRCSGKPIEIRERCFDLLRRELLILTSSQLGYSKRDWNSQIAPTGESPPRFTNSLLLSAEGVKYQQNRSIYGLFGNLVLDGGWKNFQQFSFFSDLLKILRGEISVKLSWRKQLETVATLIAQSQTSLDYNYALLWNIIALESLLIEQGDKHRESLKRRLATFLDWQDYWRDQKFENLIDSLYKKRSNFVHKGFSKDPITKSDVLFSDYLLINTLLNIVSHPDIFSSKSDILRFTERMQAAQLLGIESEIRPKTFQAIYKGFS